MSKNKVKMKENQIVFTETSSGDRTNIMSSFQLWSKETFLEKAQDSKRRHSRYRYGYIDKGYVSLLKDMMLDEFEQVFTQDEINQFSPEQVTEIFRKEISEKYGEHRLKAQLKSLKPSEIKRGCIYKDVNGKDWLYLGKVKQETDKTYLQTYQSNKKPIEIKEGNGFIKWNIENTKQYPVNVDIIKGMKKLTSLSDKPEIKLEDEYIYESGRMAYSFSEKRVKLTLL